MAAEKPPVAIHFQGPKLWSMAIESISIGK